MQTLQELTDYWKVNGDKAETQQHIYDEFTRILEDDKELKAHRHHINVHGLGYGCDQFHAMWELIIGAMPEHFSFLEIGVHAGQVICLVEILASRSGKYSEIFGVSPFDGRGVRDVPEDFKAHTLKLFADFKVKAPYLIRGDSTDKMIVKTVDAFSPFDIVFVDGSHAYLDVRDDILNYAPMVKVGGLLVMDDASCRMKLPPQGSPVNWFHGIEPVSRAVDELLPPFGPTKLPDGSAWEQQFVFMHDRCWKRIA